MKSYNYSKQNMSEIITAANMIVEEPGLPNEKVVKQVFSSMVLIINQLVKEAELKK